MLAILAPGQGSQTPNLFQLWINDNPEISAELKAEINSQINELGKLANIDLAHLGTTADEVEIRSTNNAQPLLFAAGLIGLQEIFGTVNINQVNFEVAKSELIFAGHSVGEVLAFALSQKISVEAAFKFVSLRGAQMHRATTAAQTGMAAVLGGDRDEVVKTLADFNLTPANENGGGQIVAAGLVSDLEQLMQNPPAGARVRALAVAGAFHTKYMESAQGALRELAEQISQNNLKDNDLRILSNKDGKAKTNSKEYLELLVGQVASPVRWDLTMDELVAAGVTGVIELPPAGVLSGLIKRHAPTLEIFTLKTPGDLPAAREFMIKHAPALGNILKEVK